MNLIQGQDVQLVLDMRDEYGTAIDPSKFYEEPESSDSSSSSSSSSSLVSSSSLEEAAEDPSSQIRIAAREACKFRMGKGTSAIGGGTYNRDKKTVVFEIPGDLLSKSQILVIEVGVFTSRGIAASEQVYAWIDPSVFYEKTGGVFPSLDEMKLSIRDSAPEDNHMIRTAEYDTAEICMAVIDAIHAYNTARPPVSTLFTDSMVLDSDFTDGILSRLYRMSFEHRLRNRLPYAAGGVTVDDHWAWDAYLKLAQHHEQLFQDWIKREKKAINMTKGWSATGMGLGCR